MTIQLYINSSWKTIPIESLESVITYDRRADEVFDSGSFSFVSTELKTNIPPLTICKIDSEYWLASSECNEVIPSNPKKYNHNVALIEPTYLMTCFVLGTKAFSNTGTNTQARSKVGIVIDLINQKNKLMFGADAYQFDFDYLPFEYSEREFSFGAGTTMFQAIVEIAKEQDLFPRIKTIEPGNVITIEFDKLSGGNEFVLNSSKVISRKYNQTADQYTKLLESEVRDVEDDTNSVTITDVTVRSNDFLINSDNQTLVLPTRIKKIKSVFTSGIGIGSKSVSGFFEHINEAVAQPLVGTTSNLVNFSQIFTDRNYWNAVLYMFGNNGATMVTYKSLGEFVSANSVNVSVQNIDISKSILEKAEYDLLPAFEQPKYAYYTYNSNTIDGMYKFYNNDFWGKYVFNKTVYPFLKYALEGIRTRQETDKLYGTTVVSDISLTGFADYNPINYKFDIIYYPIASCFVISNNNKSTFNEGYIKPVSRSFEFASSIADFNQLQPAIDTNNNMIGKPEITIGYHGNTYPRPMQYVKLSWLGYETRYYVSSVQTQKTLNDTTSYINLVSDYTKVAEVFGVKTQFESTRLPLTGIVDRIVYMGKYKNILGKGYRANGMIIKGANHNYFKYGATFISDDNTEREYLVVEADDNYSIATSMSESADLKGGNFENKQHPYGDVNNECEQYRIIPAFSKVGMSLDASRNLPIYNSNDIQPVIAETFNPDDFFGYIVTLSNSEYYASVKEDDAGRVLKKNNIYISSKDNLDALQAALGSEFPFDKYDDTFFVFTEDFKAYWKAQVGLTVDTFKPYVLLRPKRDVYIYELLPHKINVYPFIRIATDKIFGEEPKPVVVHKDARERLIFVAEIEYVR